MSASTGDRKAGKNGGDAPAAPVRRPTADGSRRRLSSVRSRESDAGRRPNQQGEKDHDSNEKSHVSHSRQRKPSGRKRLGFIPGSGMYRDVRRRLPYYLSDWTDAWNYRVVPATWMIFFANVLPGIAFSLDLIETTGQYGLQEVLLSTVRLWHVPSSFTSLTPSSLTLRSSWPLLLLPSSAPSRS